MKKKKVLSLFLTVLMSFSSIAPEYVLAAPEDETAVSENSVSEAEVTASEDSVSEEEVTVSEDSTFDAEATTVSEDSISVNVLPESVSEETTAEIVDPQTFIYGSSGIAYDGVAYLSADTLADFNEAQIDAYVAFCDDAADMKSAYPEMDDIVISVDSRGNISMNFEIPARIFAGPESPELNGFLQGPADNEDTLTNADEDDIDLDSIVECEYEDTLTINNSAAPIMTGENEELAAAFDLTPETFEYEDLDLQSELTPEYEEMIRNESLFDNGQKEYFYNQLDSVSKKFYNIAKKKVLKNSNTYSYSASSFVGWDYHDSAISALELTYPNKFGWKDTTKPLSGIYRWSFGTYTYTIKIPKSKHYKSSLNSQANKQIKKLVTEAYSFAAESYPSSPTYGIVYYFDKWIRDNAYYNYVGTYSSAQTTKEYYWCHRQYGVLLKGYGVCESYAMAMSCLMDAAGIRNAYCVGDVPGGGHAWNYVKMPNNNWYMLDTTWNDSSPGTYFLVKSDGKHNGNGQYYSYTQKKFTFPTPASSNYTRASENFSLCYNSVALQKGKSLKLEPNSAFNQMKVDSWSSSNPKVVKVTAKGKIKALKPGSAVISCKISGLTAKCTVYVYSTKKLTFLSNSKTSAKSSLPVGGSKAQATIQLVQKDGSAAFSTIMSCGYKVAPTVKMSKKNIVSASVTTSGNNIVLNVTPLKAGKTVVKVKFGGKTAKLNVTVRKATINAESSDAAPYDVELGEMVFE